MPTQPIPKKPQTTRQAKRAYQKRSAVPRVSEAESRRLARAEELDQRARRLREAAKTKANNAKKKAEKDTAERLKRKSLGAGIPFEKINASQRPLTGFLKPSKPRQENSEANTVQKRAGEGSSIGAISPLGKLPPTSSNGISKDDRRVDDIGNTAKQELAKSNTGKSPCIETIAVNNDVHTMQIEKRQDGRMRPPLRALRTNTKAYPRPTDKLNTPTESRAAREEDNWVDFLESNSQIARDLRSEMNEDGGGATMHERQTCMDICRYPTDSGEGIDEDPSIEAMIPTSPLPVDSEEFLCRMTTQELDDIGSSPPDRSSTLPRSAVAHVSRDRGPDAPAQNTSVKESFDYGLSELGEEDFEMITEEMSGTAALHELE